MSVFFFFNDTATTEIYTLSLHDALPILSRGDKELKAYYKTAFENSSFEAMMNYYRQNYPREPYADSVQEFPMLEMPVLQFHGLNDTALLAGALNDTWEKIGRASCREEGRSRGSADHEKKKKTMYRTTSTSIHKHLLTIKIP